MRDALTVYPSKAELQIAYLHKFLISMAPVAFAFVIVVSNAVNSGHANYGVTIVTALLAAAQAGATYFPGNAVAKAVASLAVAIGAGLVAGITDGHFTTGELLIVGAQFLAWAAALRPNGPAPQVAVTARLTGTDPEVTA